MENDSRHADKSLNKNIAILVSRSTEYNQNVGLKVGWLSKYAVVRIDIDECK